MENSNGRNYSQPWACGNYEAAKRDEIERIMKKGIRQIRDRRRRKIRTLYMRTSSMENSTTGHRTHEPALHVDSSSNVSETLERYPDIQAPAPVVQVRTGGKGGVVTIHLSNHLQVQMHRSSLSRLLSTTLSKKATEGIDECRSHFGCIIPAVN